VAYKRSKVIKKRSNLKRLYGITLGAFEALEQAQNYRCAICGGPPNGRGNKLYVDHDHATNKVRGLLCATCNSGLGHFKDKPELLEKAILYLNAHNYE
jgi:hypothetical protein